MDGDRASVRGPTIRDHLAMPISLSRWSGRVAGGRAGDKQNRLWIRCAGGDRVGFVLNERHLFLQPGWEPVRSEIVRELAAQSVPLVCPRPDLIDRWKVRGGLSLWPYAHPQEIHVYFDGPRGFHTRIGIFVPEGRVLSQARSRDRDEIRDLLRRTGLLKPRDELRPPQRVKRRVAPQEGESLETPARPPRKRSRPPALLSARPEPVGEQPPRETDPVWSQDCVFAAVGQLVPLSLQQRVDLRLRAAHGSGHGGDAYSEWRLSGYSPAPRDSRVDHGFWGPDGLVSLVANQTRVGKDAYPGRRLESVEWPWPTGIDAWIDDLIERHDGFFPAIAAYRARRMHPGLWSVARDVHASRRGDQGTFDWLDEDGSIAWLLASVLWWRTRERRRWPAASSATCPICGEGFDPRSVDLRYVLRLGANRWCPACRSALFNTNARQHHLQTADLAGSVESEDPLLDESMRFLAETESQTPFEHLPNVPALHDRSDADQWFLARVAAPTAHEVRGVADRARWTALLQRAGVLGPVVRRVRGTSVSAGDGHPCRSLFEAAIDNFLSSRAIPHEIEPVYPYHSELNPRGRRRADWLLPGRVAVEAAGLTDDAYRTKLDEKVRLAEAFGIRLIVVRPDDLSNLSAIFAEVVTGVGEGEMLPLLGLRAR